jgi:hypothetical protein
MRMHNFVSHDFVSHDQDQSAARHLHVYLLLKWRLYETLGRKSDRGQDSGEQAKADLQSSGRQD